MTNEEAVELPVRVVSREVVQNVAEFEVGCSGRVAPYAQASAGAAGSLIGGFSLIAANDSRRS